MSNTPPFPQEEGTSSSQGHSGEGQSHFKRPEFILIDERQEESQYTHFGSDSTRTPCATFKPEKEENLSPTHTTSLRFICLLGLIFCMIFGTGILIGTIVLTLIAMLSLFQNENVNQGLRASWKIYTNTAIASFGFALGLISPTLGLGLLALYFSISGDLIDEDVLRKVIRSSLNRI
jgi:hypothetical protein